MITKNLPGIPPLFLSTVLVMGCIALPLFSSDNSAVTVISPVSQNQHDECPPNSNNIWVRINTYNFPGELEQEMLIPFDTGFVQIGGHKYVNYLLGVLLQEIGPTTDFDPVDDETMKAKAVAARTVAYKNCGEIFTGDGHPGIDDSGKQQYNPQRGEDWSNRYKELVNRYQAAIDETRGMYMTYEGEVFDAKYGPISHEWTTDDTAPHLKVYDPAGHFHPSTAQQGLPQINSNHWATGLNHDDFLPQWNYRQILTHYYTGIHLQDTTGAVLTPDYRWNPLVVDWGGGSTTPPVMTPNSSYNVSLIYQNSGTIDWGDNIKLVTYWSYPNNRKSVAQEFEVENLAAGQSNELNPTTISVQLPDNFKAGYGATLSFDMKNLTDNGQGVDFSNREAGKIWFPLKYGVCTGGQCKVYLPLLLKQAVFVPPVCSVQVIVDDTFGVYGYEDPFAGSGTDLIHQVKWIRTNVFPGVTQFPSNVQKVAIDPTWSTTVSGTYGLNFIGNQDDNDHPGVGDKFDQVIFKQINIPPGTEGITVSFYLRMETNEQEAVARDHFYFDITLINPVDVINSETGHITSDKFECNNIRCNQFNDPDKGVSTEPWIRPTIPYTSGYFSDINTPYLVFWANVDDDDLTTFYLDEVKVESIKCE